MASATREYPEPSSSTFLSSRARDIDVSASSFRMLLIGGGVSGLLTVIFAAALVNKGGGAWLWVWQLVFGVLFVWFVAASGGMLSSRGFFIDGSGFYARTKGEVIGVPWEEINAIGVGTLPWIQHNRLTHPQRRQALEFYPADPGFAARHPECDRWLVDDEPAPIAGLPTVRYRFHLPALSRLPRQLERAVQEVASRKWVGHYRRHAPSPGTR